MNTPAVVNLIATRAVLHDKDCWCQGQFESHGSYCLIGALRVASDSPRPIPLSTIPGYEDLRAAVHAKGGGYGVVEFNDDRHTKYADVLEVLDTAIDVARESV